LLINRVSLIFLKKGKRR